MKAGTFTPRAIKAVTQARREATNHGHAGVNDLHLLLGLFDSEHETVASLVLKKFQVVPEELKKTFATGPRPTLHGNNLPFTTIGGQVINLAFAEAARLNHHFVGTEHLLLGILLADGQATQWLRTSGVNPEDLRNVILQEIPAGITADLNEPSPPGQTPGFIGRFLNLFSRPWPPMPAGIQESMELDFTPRARQVMALARKLAQEKQYRLDDIHLLLGLCELGQGVAVNVMTRLGGDWSAIKERTLAALGEIPGETGAEKLPDTDNLKKVFLLADRERRALNHTYLGTEHIFLGLLQAGGPAAAAICHADFDIETVRMAILQELDPNFSEGPAVLSDEATTDEPIPAQGNVFTPRVMKALAAAQTESRKQGLASVGALQLLAGLLNLGDGVAVNVLQRRGVTLEHVQTVIRQVCPSGEPVKTSVSIPYTVAAHDILSFAHQEARKMNYTLTGAEHLLLAILKSDTNSLFDFFKDAGVDREALIEIVLKEINGNA